MGLCGGGGALRQERDNLQRQKEALETQLKQLEQEKARVEENLHGQISERDQKLQQVLAEQRVTKTNLDEAVGQKDNVAQQLNKELTQLQAEKKKKDKDLKELQALFSEYQKHAEKHIEYLAGCEDKTPLILFEAYDGDQGTFLGEQLLFGSGEFHLIDRVAHSRDDPQKGSSEQLASVARQTAAGKIRVVVEQEPAGDGSPDDEKQLVVRSLYQEGGSSSSSVNFSSVAFKVWLKAPTEGSPRATAEEPAQKLDEDGSPILVDKKAASVWTVVTTKHSVVIPGDALEDPTQYGWVAEFSHGIGDDPAVISYPCGKASSGAHKAEAQLRDMGLHAQQLQQRIQDLERDKAVSAEREQDFDRMRQALEEKDRELEMKLAEATMIIQQSGGGAAAGGAGAGDGAGRGSSLERQLDKLVQSQPVAVRLPGLDSLDEDNKLRFFQLLLQEDSGILYQNEEVEVHWLQSFPFTNDDFYHHAERGLLAGRVDLKLFSKGFESIHLKCTNNDVKGLKVVPLPISAAASTKEAGPPQVIIQTICVELLELLEAHPFVKCDITVLDSQTRIEHDCTFALPIVLLKFCLPWEVDATDLTEFAKTCPRNCVAQAAGIFYREVLSDDFPLNLLTFGGILSEVERTMDRITLATSLVRHGVCKKDLNVVIYLQASKIEVLSHDKRLSEIVLYTLQDYFAFATKNLADMEQMYK